MVGYPRLFINLFINLRASPEWSKRPKFQSRGRVSQQPSAHAGYYCGGLSPGDSAEKKEGMGRLVIRWEAPGMSS